MTFNKVVSKVFSGIKMTLTDGTNSLSLDMSGNIKGQTCTPVNIKAGDFIKMIAHQFSSTLTTDVVMTFNQTSPIDIGAI